MPNTLISINSVDSGNSNNSGSSINLLPYNKMVGMNEYNVSGGMSSQSVNNLYGPSANGGVNVGPSANIGAMGHSAYNPNNLSAYPNTNSRPPYGPNTFFPYITPNYSNYSQPVQPFSQPQPSTQSGSDYNIPTMASFISWCAFSILKQQRSPSPDLDLSIKSVLFATRLPKSTIVIALEYLNQRYSCNSFQDYSNHEIYTIIIISFILANKFNDDNTFTNKSWHGATGLKLAALNSAEIEWLSHINWNLNVIKFELNIKTLITCCETWLIKYDKQQPISPIYSPTYSGNSNYQPQYHNNPCYHYDYQNLQPIPPFPQYFPYQYYPSPMSQMGDIYQDYYKYPDERLMLSS